MDINMTLIGQTIAMIVFVWFCMKFIWPPIMAALEERQKQIEEGLAAADLSQEKLAEAAKEADGIVAEARQQQSFLVLRIDPLDLDITEIGRNGGTAIAKIEEGQVLPGGKVQPTTHFRSIGRAAGTHEAEQAQKYSESNLAI